ncbi:MAG: guanylate kinase [Minisyncoccia bacterium]
MEPHITGKIILVFGPSGSGKGELMRYALSLYPELRFPVSSTTRSMRPGETNGKEYHFVTREEFERERDSGQFLESAEYGGNLYGTPKREVLDALSSGHVVLHEIEMQGVQAIEKLLPKEALRTVFVDAGSWEELRARILARAPIPETELEKRKVRYEHETAYKNNADVIISNRNGELDAAKDKFSALVGSVIREAKGVS